MKANGWQGDPISVLEYQGNRYVLDGHHRVTAAREAGISVPYQSIPVQELPRFGYPTVDSVLWAAAEAGGGY